MRLIDADALKSECRDIIQNYKTRGDDYGIGKCGGMTQAMNEIDYAPTIAAIPVEWLQKYTAVGVTPRGDRLTEGKERLIVQRILNDWQKEQEAR